MSVRNIDPPLPSWDGPSPPRAADPPIRRQIDRLDWAAVEDSLDQVGCARLPGLLQSADCERLMAMYPCAHLYRSKVVMARHGFGRGQYQYFRYPLPEPVAAMRTALYRHLAPIANRWHQAMGVAGRFPPDHADYLAICHANGQSRPTPLMLRYRDGDYNCLHQDLYGEHAFPLQVVTLLSEPGRDFSGGQFVLTEQRPRMQSRIEVVDLRQGDAVVFAVNERPVRGTRGWYRVKLRHGVSRLHHGERLTLGVIFHDAT